mgnify:FL=1
MWSVKGSKPLCGFVTVSQVRKDRVRGSACHMSLWANLPWSFPSAARERPLSGLPSPEVCSVGGLRPFVFLSARTTSSLSMSIPVTDSILHTGFSKIVCLCFFGCLRFCGFLIYTAISSIMDIFSRMMAIPVGFSVFTIGTMIWMSRLPFWKF